MVRGLMEGSVMLEMLMATTMIIELIVIVMVLAMGK